jgi:hypothetical protein
MPVIAGFFVLSAKPSMAERGGEGNGHGSRPGAWTSSVRDVLEPTYPYSNKAFGKINRRIRIEGGRRNMELTGGP